MELPFIVYSLLKQCWSVGYVSLLTLSFIFKVTVCWILQGVVRHGTKFCFLEFDYNIFCLICYEIMSVWIFVYLTSKTLFERISPNIDETVIVNRKYMEQPFIVSQTIEAIGIYPVTQALESHSNSQFFKFMNALMW